MGVGTGAFSSMEAERGVSVDVVGNREAFVGYYVPRGEPNDDQYVPEDAPNSGDSVKNGDRIPLVEVRSRFNKEQKISLVGVQIEQGYGVLDSESYEVKRKLPDSEEDEYEDVEHVDITEGTTEPDPIDTPENGFGPGGYERITAEVDGIGSGTEVDMVVTVTLKGVESTGIAAQLFGDTREFTITGETISTTDLISGVKFPGNSGNPQIQTTTGDGTLKARAYFRQNGNGNSSDNIERTSWTGEIPVNGPLNLRQFGEPNNGPTIVGIEIDGIDGVFVRSNKNDDNVVTHGNTVSAEQAFGNQLVTDD
ncbi:hypothetical protein GCM10008992_12650 [Halorubrum aquaticum]